MERTGWTRENLRHGLAMLRFGRTPAATVYDSIGPNFFLALDEGWLNLGLWEGDGSDPGEAPLAVRRLVAHLAADLPRGGDVLDVGNGLAAQDPLVAEVASPRSLIALNVTLSQLRAGRERLATAGAGAVNGDACRMPFANECFDGVISVEAAFHFPSRRTFFTEAHRVLRPGGVLTMSDVPTLRMPGGPREALAALAQLRLWGLTRAAAASPERIVALAAAAGFVDVRSALVGDRVIGPALRFVHDRLERVADVPRSHALAAKVLASQAGLLWERGILDYLVLRARRPTEP